VRKKRKQTKSREQKQSNSKSQAKTYQLAKCKLGEADKIEFIELLCNT